VIRCDGLALRSRPSAGLAAGFNDDTRKGSGFPRCRAAGGHTDAGEDRSASNRPATRGFSAHPRLARQGLALAISVFMLQAVEFFRGRFMFNCLKHEFLPRLTIHFLDRNSTKGSRKLSMICRRKSSFAHAAS
jgi:hypothetical protein